MNGNFKTMNKRIMKPNTLLTQYKDFMLETQTPLDYLLVVCIHILGLTVVSGVAKIFYELLIHTSKYNNTTFGVFDTLG